MATTAPKYFEMLRASRSGGGRPRLAGAVVVCMSCSSLAQAGEASPDPVVEDDGRPAGACRSRSMYQSALIDANTIPIWAIPRASAPMAVPATEP